jgi:hypothetical protein
MMKQFALYTFKGTWKVAEMRKANTIEVALAAVNLTIA